MRLRGAMEDDIVSDESDVVAMAEGEEEEEKRGRRRARWHERVVERAERWIFLYNVTTGLYMLDWWERCVVNAVFLVFFAIAGYNSAHYLQRIGAGLLAWAWACSSSSSSSSSTGGELGAAG